MTLNTDNRLISDTTLTREYQLAHEQLGLGWDELKEVAFLGFQAAFLPYEAKVKLLEEVEEEMKGLEAPYQSGSSGSFRRNSSAMSTNSEDPR